MTCSPNIRSVEMISCWVTMFFHFQGESFPSSDGFPSLPLSLVVPVIHADLH